MENRPLISVMTNSGAADMALNLIYSLRKHGMDSFEVWSLDDPCFTRMTRYGLPVQRVDVTSPVAYQNYGSRGFKAIVGTKLALIAARLNAGHDVLFMDADIVVAGDIFAGLPRNCDVAIQTSSPSAPYERLCTGFMVLKSTPLTCDFIDACRKSIRHADVIEDEDAFNRVYRCREELGLGAIRIAALPGDRYQYGETYFRHNGEESKPCLIHNNFVKGVKRKIRRFKQHGLWYLECEDFHEVISCGEGRRV